MPKARVCSFSPAEAVRVAAGVSRPCSDLSSPAGRTCWNFREDRASRMEFTVSSFKGKSGPSAQIHFPSSSRAKERVADPLYQRRAVYAPGSTAFPSADRPAGAAVPAKASSRPSR